MLNKFLPKPALPYVGIFIFKVSVLEIPGSFLFKTTISTLLGKTCLINKLTESVVYFPKLCNSNSTSIESNVEVKFDCLNFTPSSSIA